MITNEWAKQLAHDVISPNLDFGNMIFIQIQPNIREYRFAIPPTIVWWKDSWQHIDPVRVDKFEIVTVEINKYYDAINQEYTRLGYYPRKNVLLIGDTYPINGNLLELAKRKKRGDD